MEKINLKVTSNDSSENIILHHRKTINKKKKQQNCSQNYNLLDMSQTQYEKN
jgi:hypothetical protein